MPTAGARLADGSGLDREGRVTAALLTTLLARAADPERPGLRPVLTGLPVAGFTGTLSTRYQDGTDTTGATGLIRAKTGTLSGVNALSGTVVDPQGRLLAFAFLAAGSTEPAAAEAALDTRPPPSPDRAAEGAPQEALGHPKSRTKTPPPGEGLTYG